MSDPVDPVGVVEAALFSAGKPLHVDELAENTGLGKRKVKSALAALQKSYAERDTALEVDQAGDKWAMQVKTVYAEAAARLAPMEVPVKVLKTLALVAYHQPMLQSELVDMVGAKCYDHVRELHERGLVKKCLHDRSFILTTSEKFPEYFGIPATDREKIKRFLAEKVGLPVAERAGKPIVVQEELPDGDTDADAGSSADADAEAGPTDEPAGPDVDAPPAPPEKVTGDTVDATP